MLTIWKFAYRLCKTFAKKKKIKDSDSNDAQKIKNKILWEITTSASIKSQIMRW